MNAEVNEMGRTEMKTHFAYAGVVYWIATVAAAATMTTHVAQWSRNGNETAEAVRSTSEGTAKETTGRADVNLSAAYRDGVYMAKLSMARGEQKEPAVGRWATEAQRDAFVSGFDHGGRTTAENIEK